MFATRNEIQDMTMAFDAAFEWSDGEDITAFLNHYEELLTPLVPANVLRDEIRRIGSDIVRNGFDNTTSPEFVYIDSSIRSAEVSRPIFSSVSLRNDTRFNLTPRGISLGTKKKPVKVENKFIEANKEFLKSKKQDNPFDTPLGQYYATTAGGRITWVTQSGTS